MSGRVWVGCNLGQDVSNSIDYKSSFDSYNNFGSGFVILGLGEIGVTSFGSRIGSFPVGSVL